MSKRKNHGPAFKAKAALAGLSGEKPIAELGSEFGVRQTLVHKWVRRLKESAVGVFVGEIKTEEAKKEKHLQILHAKIGQLTVKRDFLAEAWGKRRTLPAGKAWSFQAMRSSASSGSVPCSTSLAPVCTTCLKASRP